MPLAVWENQTNAEGDLVSSGHSPYKFCSHISAPTCISTHVVSSPDTSSSFFFSEHSLTTYMDPKSYNLLHLQNVTILHRFKSTFFLLKLLRKKIFNYSVVSFSIVNE